MPKSDVFVGEQPRTPSPDASHLIANGELKSGKCRIDAVAKAFLKELKVMTA